MTLFIQGEGQRATKGLKPADTNVAAMYTVVGAVGATVELIHIASTGAADASVWYNDGATDFLVVPIVTMAADGYITLQLDLALKQGWSIKVQSSVANLLTFTLVVAEFFRTARNPMSEGAGVHR
jgi:hypothetical protein